MRDDVKAQNEYIARQEFLNNAYSKPTQDFGAERFENNLDREDIHQIYEKNCAWKLHEQLKRPKDYLEKVTKRIPLNELYEVLDYIYTGKDQKICPVLLEIKDENLRHQENGVDEEEAQRRKDETNQKIKKAAKKATNEVEA